MNIFRLLSFQILSLFPFFMKLKGKESLNIDSSLFLEWITLLESRSNEHFSKRVNLLSFQISSLFSFIYKIKRKGEFEYRFYSTTSRFFILAVNDSIYLRTFKDLRNV